MREKIEKLQKNLAKVIVGKEQAIELLLVAFFANGNILLEDVPGVGKTTLAKALAISIDSEFKRVQFTPDLLPNDILGYSLFNPQSSSFEFKKGPLFANIVLADEINRASPRTQAALLEAMSEKQISIDGETYKLKKPFLVIATQNPVEYHGTYPLPEAQLDRFYVLLEIGYPAREHEMSLIFSHANKHPLADLQSVISEEEVVEIQEEVKKVFIEESLAEYIMTLITATREHNNVELGGSPRSLLILARCAQAKAYINNRDFVTPDDIKEIFSSVMAHRLVLNNQAKYSGIKAVDICKEILNSVKIPK
ncbi:MoxR family ATPase [Lentisphaerota bacterium WC36G]|nr:MoxR family ATPase [Lentisphaerae bacterium WC36]